MGTSFLPAKDADLLAWATQFSTVVGPSSTTLGLTAAQMTSFNAAMLAFSTALAKCEPGIRNKQATAAKNSAKIPLRRQAYLLSRIVEGQADVSDAEKIELGVNVKAHPVPKPAPAEAPAFDLVSVKQNTAKFRAHDATTPSRRGRPNGVATLSIFSFIGAAIPSELTDWTLNGTTSKTTVDVAFDPTLPIGTKAWVCAYWSTATGLNGPACTPIEVTLMGGAVLPQSPDMKLAA